MTPEHWQRIKPLLAAALEREPGERSTFLDEACAATPSLRSELESLIASHEQAGNFAEKPALELMADSLQDNQAESIVGHTLGQYHIIEQLGAGGMSEVYLAEDMRLGRKVALKLLSGYPSREEERVRRFRQEAFATSALNHPNIVTVYEIGEWQERDFIATEFIEGVTLRARLRNRRFPLAEALEISLQIASALSAAHSAGIVHRDIKPENVMLRPDGLVKVLDFGIAKYPEPTSRAAKEALVKTMPGTLVGTVAYMSPEQARGSEVDARTDIWSLGVILYEMTARELPFPGPTPSDRIAAILVSEPVPLRQRQGDLPPKLEQIISRALAKNKEQRYSDAAELAADLRKLRGTLGDERPARFSVPAVVRSAFSTPLISKIKRHQSRAAVAAVALLLIGLAIGLYYFLSSDNSKQAAPATRVSSIAVLPFKRLSADDNDEYLGLGMADTLITKLSNLRQIIVRPTGAVRKYMAPDQDPLAAGREQRVDAVLDGSIQKSGDKLRVTVRLVSVADGATLWASQFDQNFTDIFAMQDAISERVAGALALELTGEERKLLTKRYTENTEAYQNYLKGRYFLNKRTAEDIRKASEYFKQAVALDPNNALAYLGLGDCYHQSIYSTSSPSRELIPKAKAMARKALEIDGSLGEAHALLSILNDADWDWNEALREYQLAISLSPGYANAYGRVAFTLAKRGRFDEALAAIRKAGEIDPTNLGISADIASILCYAGRYDEAIEQSNKTLELDPNFSTAYAQLGVAYWGKRMYKESLGPLQRAVELEGEGSVRMIQLAMGYGFAGQKEKARDFLRRLKKRSESEYVDPTWFAGLYTAIGDKDKALDWIEKAYAERSVAATALLADTRFITIRSEPRYQAILSRMGLAS